MNAFGRSTLKLGLFIAVITVCIFVMNALVAMTIKAFGVWAGFAVMFAPLLAVFWWSLYRHEKFQDEIKDL
jgi:uncharacterized membrane protein YvlD (DUF360 family)